MAARGVESAARAVQRHTTRRVAQEDRSAREGRVAATDPELVIEILGHDLPLISGDKLELTDWARYRMERWGIDVDETVHVHPMRNGVWRVSDFVSDRDLP